MKKIIPVILILCMLCSCAKSGPKEHDLSNYETDGYYQVFGSDTAYIDYIDAAIPDLILSDKKYTAELNVFEKGNNDSFSKKASESYTLYKQGETSAYQLYRDSETTGGKFFPDQFIRYSLENKYYYSVGGITIDDGYSASADGKTMILKNRDGLLVKYDAIKETLTPVGTTSYEGKNYGEFGNSWTVKFALDETGRYAAYTSQRRAAGQTDVWLCDLDTGKEEILAQNVLVNGELSFSGNRLLYCIIDISEAQTKYRYILTDISTKAQTTVDWDGNYTTVKNGFIVGQSKVYEIESATDYPVDSSVNGNFYKGVLSADNNYVVSVYGDNEGLYLNVTAVKTGKSTRFKLPGDFKANYKDFAVLDMRDNKVIFQTMFMSADKSGDYTAYYTIDLGFALQK